MASSTAARRALALEEPLVPGALPDDEATKLAVFRAAILVHGAWTGACVAQRSRGDASAAGKRVARRRASLLAPREARETARGARRLHRLLGRAAFYSAYAAWALLLLALFEKPWWCRGRPDACGAGPRAHLYPNSGLSRLGPGAALAAAGALLGGLLAEAALEAVARDALADFRGAGRPLFAWRCGALALCAADAAAAFCAGGAASLTPASALCRCLLVLTHDRNVRTQLRLIARVAPDVLSVLALLGCVVLLYAWFATLIFQNETAEGREVFPTYGASVWQLFILVTTSNFPDVMQRAYAKNRATFLFFALFLVLCLWFLLNVVLAVVSDGYTTSTAAEAALAAASKRRNLDDAYDILLSLERRDGRGVSRDAMARLFKELNATASVPHLDGDAQALVFAVLDHDGSMAVDKAEFELLVDALKLRFVRVDDRPDAASLRGRVAAVVGDARFDRCVDALLVANLVFEAAYGAERRPVAATTFERFRAGDRRNVVTVVLGRRQEPRGAEPRGRRRPARHARADRVRGLHPRLPRGTGRAVRRAERRRRLPLPHEPPGELRQLRDARGRRADGLRLLPERLLRGRRHPLRAPRADAAPRARLRRRPRVPQGRRGAPPRAAQGADQRPVTATMFERFGAGTPRDIVAVALGRRGRSSRRSSGSASPSRPSPSRPSAARSRATNAARTSAPYRRRRRTSPAPRTSATTRTAATTSRPRSCSSSSSSS